VARAGGRMQPLCARYEVAALEVLGGFAPEDRTTVLVERLAPAIVDVEDEDELLNVNAPEDLWHASALLRRRGVTPAR